MADLITRNLENNFRALVQNRGTSMGGVWVPEGSTRGSQRINQSEQYWAAPVLAQTGSGLVKTAGSGIIYTQPQFFSPIHTPINWQIPSKRKEIYQWMRFYYENEPKVATTIDFYSRFPINGYKNVCTNRRIKKFYDDLGKKINLIKWLRIISYETHLLGDCFPFLEVDCPVCGGSGNNGGQVCEHDGGAFKRLVILNPEYVEVYSNFLAPAPMLAFMPSEELRNTVLKKGPGYEKLSKDVRDRIAAGKPIGLDNRNASHIKYMDNGYNRYGTGLVRRLFPMLAYKTKLLTAQWVVAERLILPIKIAKVGSEERPASASDLAQVQAQLAQTANDPNLTLVTHHAFELDWFGASGKVLQLTTEFEMINQEILDGLGINKALLNGEGPCFHPDVEILTEKGWKYYQDVADNEKLAGFNPKSGSLIFEHFKNRIIRQYKGELVHFKTSQMDMLVTTNHRMWVQERTSKNSNEAYSSWKIVSAEDVKYRSRMRSCFDDWQGEIPESWVGMDGSASINFGGCQVKDVDNFIRFLGYFVAEGWANVNQAGLSQKMGTASATTIDACIKAIGIPFSCQHDKDPRETPFGFCQMTHWHFQKSQSAWLMENIPGKAKDKRLPKWLRNLPKYQLTILLDALVDGNGSFHKKSPLAYPYKSYITSSKLLADDVMEIALKLGYAPTISDARVKDGIWVVNMASSKIGKFPVLDTLQNGDGVLDRRSCISRVPYEGVVWCFEMPNEFLVVRRNGKVLITLNTYSNAAIGVEVMIDKLESWRQELAEWVEQKIYLPIAMMKGFIGENEWGEKEYIYPKLKWNIMHLRDQQQYRTFMLQMHEKGTISTQRLLENFDIDYNEEVEMLRYERAKGPSSQMGGGFGGGAPGGMPGGMPDLGLGGGGAPVLGPPEAAGAAGGLGGMSGGAPGGAPAPMGGAPLTAQTIPNIQEFGGKVLKQKTRNKIQKYKERMLKSHAPDASGMERDEKGRVIFTGPERELLKALADEVRKGEINYNIYAQFPVKAGGEEYTIDFAMVPIKLGLEVDGALFHSTPEQQADDRTRDGRLAMQGWTILRFTDRQVESKMRDVIDSIIQNMIRKENYLKKRETGSPQ